MEEDCFGEAVGKEAGMTPSATILKDVVAAYENLVRAQPSFHRGRRHLKEAGIHTRHLVPALALHRVGYRAMSWMAGLVLRVDGRNASGDI